VALGAAVRTVTHAWRALPARQRLMLAGLALLLVLVQLKQPFPATAPLHHLQTLALLLAAPFLLRRCPLSDAALGCIVLFLVLHTIGGRWTYTNVPYDAWARALSGHTLSELFGWSRNHYDRLVHFGYGALAILPVREALQRHAGLGPRTSLYIAVESVLAVSALYEIFEWLLTLAMEGSVATAYNGQQGDLWDAQKDMALAALGALLAAGALATRRKHDGRDEGRLRLRTDPLHGEGRE
jgi:putative membrane protein